MTAPAVRRQRRPTSRFRGGRISHHPSPQRRTADHSALILANLFTLAHFSVSSAMNLPKSAGEPENTPQPRSSRRLRIAGSASAALTSLLSLATMSDAVPLGTAMPYQPLAS